MIFSLFSLFIPLVYGTDYETSVWPQPANFKTGGQVVSVNPPLLFHTVGGEIETLTQAYARYTSIIFPHLTDKINISTVKNVEFVTEVNVEVQDRSEAYPDIDTDESYELTIPDDSKSIVISSQTIYGALLALETLSQLIIFNFEEEMYKIPNVPISIQDAPRYPHRGMLLDTSRHFQPIPELRRTIDALSYAKYNVLHWHVVDTQSFPFQSLSSPRLWEGAYSEQERYSHSDILGLIEYGRARGIRIMIEFDMPGHGASW
jgi:hexosaminidase